jgi:hypothetical protein
MRALGLLVLLLVAASAGAQSIKYYPGGAWGRLYLSPEGASVPGWFGSPYHFKETLAIQPQVCNYDDPLCVNLFLPTAITPTTGGTFQYPAATGLSSAMEATGDWSETSASYVSFTGIVSQVACDLDIPCYANGISVGARGSAADTDSFLTGVQSSTNNLITTGTGADYAAFLANTFNAANSIGKTYSYYASGEKDGGANVEPWNVFKFYGHSHVGRTLFTIPGACGGGDCKTKTTVPGYALGGFAVEARGGRGVLMAGSAGQWQVIDEGAKPTCDVDRRGAYWHEFGGAGVKDTVEVCAKDAGDAYAWRTIY